MTCESDREICRLNIKIMTFLTDVVLGGVAIVASFKTLH